MHLFFFFGVFLCSTLQRSDSDAQIGDTPGTVLNCCEGDILLLLDSSGSVANYEFSRLLPFLAELLRPFSLGRGHVRVGLLQVGTRPNLEFGLNEHSSQSALQEALRSTRQLHGDTNTEAALAVARRLLAGAGAEVPRILLWLTDGVQPGDVDGPMAELKAQGVSVLVVSTGHGNYQVLQRAVTPPVADHLYFVDIDDISIITEDLRDAIIDIIRAERLRVVHLSSHDAVLQWRPVLSADSGFYELQYSCVPSSGVDCGEGRQHRRTLPGDSSWAELKNLQPETTYSATLRPESNQELFSALSVTFTTHPDVLSPAVVSVSDSGPHQLRVSWGPLQPARVQSYRVEYGAIPSGPVSTVALHSHQNSTLLSGLQPDTQYLITVGALHASGRETAMSVRACTQQAISPSFLPMFVDGSPAAALPALADLQLTPTDLHGVQAEWSGHGEGLRGYWVSWEPEISSTSSSKPSASSAYLPANLLSMQLTQLVPDSRVCVSPVYSSGRGEGLCCTVERHTDSSLWD
ncbi:von Willebrand factor A domain-containing protein 1-like isoform X2 [Genypterus blacodes]|uniref:von Willebrand factor A domain-containing protein 1-like isoform X2 n=1 Tax=Genypterus blacodes TaxID=154954 RepID=UPI003F76537D